MGYLCQSCSAHEQSILCSYGSSGIYLFMTINIFNTGNVYFKSILRSNMFTIMEQNNNIKLQPMSVAKYWILQSDETKC